MKRLARFLGAILLGFASVLSYAQAPVPFVNQPLIPDATPPGGAQFTLTVNGTGFVSSSVVQWNGNALATQFVSASQLTATVPAEDIATASTASVTVVNPAPGGGPSNVVFFTVTTNAGNFVGFTLTSSLTVGYYPWSVIVGDFNGDGKLDVAASTNWSPTLSIFLGDGAGNFKLASTPATNFTPTSMVVGDFNGDGKLDLATAHKDDNMVSILLGDGTGNFTVASSLVVGASPCFLAAMGDFNGDGKLDLATANGSDNAVSILLGDGTGNFTLAASVAVGSPVSIAVGDFNGDGKLDLATANGGDNNVSILLGDGTGHFTLASSVAVNNPVSVVAADFNGDGKLDLATADPLPIWFQIGSVSIFQGDGRGNFTPMSSLSVGADPVSVVVGDFNGDGKLDLMTLNYGDGTIPILLEDGTGNFTLIPSQSVGFSPDRVAVGDFNGDGKLDLAKADELGNGVDILLGIPPGPYVTYGPPSLIFGPQLLGTSSSPQPVILSSIGSETLDITRVVTSANFSQTNNCPRELPPGGTCTANVVFTPHTVDTIAGTITITDNAPKSPQTIAVTGVGIAVTLLPSGLDFGSQQVGTTSPPQTVTLTNYAPKTVTIFGGDFSGNNPNSFRLQNTTCEHSLPPGGSCTINIVFVPNAAYQKTATLEVNDNGGGSPQIVTLYGRGTQ